MKPQGTVYTGKTKKGTDILIRYPLKSDVEAMTQYINTLSKEQTFILFQGEQNTVSQEMKYLRSLLTKVKNKKAVCLLVFQGDMLIGHSQIEMKEKAEKHIGNFGISIAQGFRGEGIGKLLMQLVLEEGKKYLEGFRTCTLSVFSNNCIAYPMYQQFGFIEYGKLPKGLLHKDCLVDHIFMYKVMEASSHP